MQKFISSFIAISALAGLASACAADLPAEEQESAGSEHQALLNCANPEGTNAMIAALAVAMGSELGRWQVTTDFTTKIGTYNQRQLTLSSAGLARCAEMKNTCSNIKALLFFQDAKYDNYIRFPHNVKLSAYSFAARLTAGFDAQKICEDRAKINPPKPGPHGAPPPPHTCPAEPHLLKLTGTAPGGCDMNFTYKVTSPTGGKLQWPQLLKNKLIWANDGGSAEKLNPYVQFKATADTVTVDPTWDLNQPGSASGGSCTTSCQKYSTSKVLGNCCSCNGKSGTFLASPTANVYKCSAGG